MDPIERILAPARSREEGAMTIARTGGAVTAVAVIALVVVLTMQGFATSQTAGVDSAKPKTITVTSTARVSTSPDIAVFKVSVRGESADGSQAFELVARQGASVLRAVRGGPRRISRRSRSVSAARSSIEGSRPNTRSTSRRIASR
jgi:uncharacterized protein YggE